MIEYCVNFGASGDAALTDRQTETGVMERWFHIIALADTE